MKLLGVAALATLHAAPQAASDARSRELIRTLKREVLPKESGYLGIIGKSALMVTVNGRMLAAQSQKSTAPPLLER